MDQTSEASRWFRNQWRKGLVEQDVLNFGCEIERSADQWEEEWANELRLVRDREKSLTEIHVFVLAHVVRRPITVYRCCGAAPPRGTLRNTVRPLRQSQVMAERPTPELPGAIRPPIRLPFARPISPPPPPPNYGPRPSDRHQALAVSRGWPAHKSNHLKRHFKNRINK